MPPSPPRSCSFPGCLAQLSVNSELPLQLLLHQGRKERLDFWNHTQPQGLEKAGFLCPPRILGWDGLRAGGEAKCPSFPCPRVPVPSPPASPVYLPLQPPQGRSCPHSLVNRVWRKEDRSCLWTRHGSSPRPPSHLPKHSILNSANSARVASGVLTSVSKLWWKVESRGSWLRRKRKSWGHMPKQVLIVAQCWALFLLAGTPCPY